VDIEHGRRKAISPTRLDRLKKIPLRLLMFLEKRSLESRRFERHSRRTRCSRNGLIQARRNWIMWFIGLDWADEHHDICVITDVGKQIGSLRIALKDLKT
jgi:hypothetical protein